MLQNYEYVLQCSLSTLIRSYREDKISSRQSLDSNIMVMNAMKALPKQPAWHSRATAQEYHEDFLCKEAPCAKFSLRIKKYTNSLGFSWVPRGWFLIYTEVDSTLYLYFRGFGYQKG